MEGSPRPPNSIYTCLASEAMGPVGEGNGTRNCADEPADANGDGCFDRCDEGRGRLGPNRHYVADLLLTAFAKVGPFLHQTAALIEDVAALVGTLEGVALGM